MISSQEFVHTDDCLGHRLSNSVIHKATGLPAASRPFLPAVPIDRQWTFFPFHRNGSAGGFVNRAVNTTKNPAVSSHPV